MRQRGFTLIELMVVLSITAVLGTLGVAGFTSYNQSQILQSSASEVATMLNLAKSRAQSQIKPSTICTSGVLTGYSVIILENEYSLYLRCSVGGDIKIPEQNKAKILPPGLSFDSNSNQSFFFPVSTGGTQAGQIVISGYGRSKTIIVNSLGGVGIQ